MELPCPDWAREQFSRTGLDHDDLCAKGLVALGYPVMLIHTQAEVDTVLSYIEKTKTKDEL